METVDQSNFDGILSIPDTTPVGANLSQPHRELLLKSQPLLMTAHRAIVNDVQNRNGEFLPFGIGLSASGEASTFFLEHNPLFPDGKKILVGEDQSRFGLDQIGIHKGIGYITLALQNEANLGNIVVAANCFPNPSSTGNHSNRDGIIHMCLEDAQATAVYCFGTYQRLAGGQGWEFSNLSGKAIEPTIFKKPDQDFGSLLA